jgi:hypothetical protein
MILLRKEGPSTQVFNVQEISLEHFYWPDIDVDLDLERIPDPERFSLVART